MQAELIPVSPGVSRVADPAREIGRKTAEIEAYEKELAGMDPVAITSKPEDVSIEAKIKQLQGRHREPQLHISDTALQASLAKTLVDIEATEPEKQIELIETVEAVETVETVETVEDIAECIKELRLEHLYVHRKLKQSGLSTAREDGTGAVEEGLTLESLKAQLLPAPDMLHSVTTADIVVINKKIAELGYKGIENIDEFTQYLESCPLVDQETVEDFGLTGEYLLVEADRADTVVSHLKCGSDTCLAREKLLSELATTEKKLADNEALQFNTGILVTLNNLIWGSLDSAQSRLNLANLYLKRETFEQEMKIREHNQGLVQQIDIYRAHLRGIELTSAIKEANDQLYQLEIMVELSYIKGQIECLAKYRDAQEQLLVAQTQLEQQLDYERFIYLREILNRYTISQNNRENRERLDRIDQELTSLENDIGDQEAELDIVAKVLAADREKLSVITYRLAEQEKIQVKLEETTANLVSAEQDILPYHNYAKIMGNKGITSRLLFNKIKAIESYINTIIQTFTKYRIHILFDEKKQNISIVTENTSDGKFLSTTRLSGYEKLMLQIAFKRALNKFSYNSKSSLIIIDEALDCIDQENFACKLPEVMNLITQDYSTCLAISQRDISHISDILLTIKRLPDPKGGKYSVIEQN